MSDKKRILVVDDEPDFASLVQGNLEKEGFDVDVAFNGVEGLEKVQANPPDAIVLDVMMPDVSGLEVLRFMRQEPNLQNIPVVLVSAKSMPSDIKKGMDAGASRYLTKPFSFLDLKNTVDELVLARNL